ncbi:methyltransferase family protein [Nevskia soli]|uniref:methyltransferase family protein n=1 Tax=Nevskia soli TaxID=418856 RepID=UPI0015D857ED|nr:isoprenylcysteine carboxylmethyltransferase family protein [Nevskia soli]
MVTLAFVVFGGPGILIVYVPAWITRWQIPPGSWPLRAIACILFAVGLLPLGESIARFFWAGQGTASPSHPTEVLVATGFYRYVRNPMYIGVLVLIAGQCVLFRSESLWIYLGIVTVGFELFVLFYEEPTLRKKYGASYEEYCRNVRRWIPRLKAYREPRESPTPSAHPPRARTP